MRTTIVEGVEYYTRANPTGYGYQIMKKLPVEGKPDKFTYHQVFLTDDKQLMNSLFTRMENGEVIDTFPYVGVPTCPEKILVYRSKHYTAYYSVPTQESLYKAMRHILTQEYNYDGSEEYINNIRPENVEHNDSGVNSQEEIDSIPIEKVREEVQERWNAYLLRVKKNHQYNRDWENLKLVVTTEDNGNPAAAMAAFEQDNYEFESLITV